MIDGILLFSSINAVEQVAEEVDLNAVLNHIESDLEVVIHQKNARILHNKLPVIQGLSILVHQLFYNLINNALKFTNTSKAPLIAISAEVVDGAALNETLYLLKDKQYHRIIIQDNGIGFGQKEAEKIFKTFSRLHAKDKYEGTGLGLALCKKIVERHNGAMYAEGKENEGATFYILLPI